MEPTADMQRRQPDTANRSGSPVHPRAGEIPALLDGRLPTQADGLAAVMRERIRLAADWFLPIQQVGGSFAYSYDPRLDRYTYVPYNEVRHAGADYALFLACQLFDDEALRSCASKAAEYIVDSSLSVPSGGAAYLYDGKAKLGGVALAIVALLEGRRALDSTVWDDAALALGEFVLGMEVPAEPGRYFQSYVAAPQAKLLTPQSNYYPGEALLALTRLHRAFPDGPWLAAAQRAARYLIRVKDGDQIAAGRVPRIDHWLTMALSELARFDPNPDLRAIVQLQTEAMIASHFPANDPHPWRIGAARREPTPNFTSTATHAEALNAAWGLARALGDTDWEERLSQAALRNVQFLLRVQYTDANTAEFDRPERAIGGWAQDIGHAQIRFDYVQHGMSALIGAVSMLADDRRAPAGEPESVAAPLDQPTESVRVGASTRPEGAPGAVLRSILAAAQQRGVPVRSIDGARRMVELGTGAYGRRYWEFATSGTSLLGVKIAKDKHLANQLLRAAGLPVPRSLVVSSAAGAARAAAEIGYPVVLKPNRGNKGRDVFVGIQSETELNELIARAFGGRLTGEWLIETFVAGHEYRVLVIGGAVAAVNHRISPSVTGDGSSTVQQLIDKVNADPARSSVRGVALKPIRIGAQLDDMLRRQKLTLDAVPNAGQAVRLNGVSNVSAGGSTRDMTGRIHPDNARVASLAAQVVGLDFAGIDLVVPDIERSIWETGGGIVEINSQPGIIDHLEPTDGAPQDIGAVLLNMLYPPGQPVRARMVAVLESEDSAAICRLLGQILTVTGSSVGIASRDGIWIDGMRLRGVESGHPHGIRALLNNPAVEIAILEIDRATIRRHGLGVDACDLVVLGEPGDEVGEARVRPVELVLAAALDPAGAVVLNASAGADEAIAASGPRIVPFAPRRSKQADALGSRGPVVMLRGRGKTRGIAVVDGDRAEVVVPAALLAGIRDAYPSEAVMGAVAAAVALGIDVETIRVALRTFGDPD